MHYTVQKWNANKGAMQVIAEASSKKEAIKVARGYSQVQGHQTESIWVLIGEDRIARARNGKVSHFAIC
jgi:hypothetical protein